MEWIKIDGLSMPILNSIEDLMEALGAAPPRCSACLSEDNLVGETLERGDPICWPCVYRFGSAADANTCSETERRMLLEAHGDVIDLVSVWAVGSPTKRRWYWLWKGWK